MPNLVCYVSSYPWGMRECWKIHDALLRKISNCTPQLSYLILAADVHDGFVDVPKYVWRSHDAGKSFIIPTLSFSMPRLRTLDILRSTGTHSILHVLRTVSMPTLLELVLREFDGGDYHMIVRHLQALA